MIEVLEEIFSRNNEITSIKQMKSLVLKELKKDDELVRLSNNRLLRIISRLGWIKVHITKNKSPRAVKNCFVCGTRMEETKNLTLTGEKAAVGLNCHKCSIRLGNPFTRPARYAFYRKGRIPEKVMVEK